MNRSTNTEQENHPEVHLNLNVRGLQTSPDARHQRALPPPEGGGASHLPPRPRAVPLPGPGVGGGEAPDQRPREGLPPGQGFARAARGHRRLLPATPGHRALGRGHPRRARVEGADVHPPARVLRGPRDPDPELGDLRAAGPHHRPAHPLGPDDGGRRLAVAPGRARRGLPQRPRPSAHRHPQLPLQSHGTDLQRGRPPGARRGGTPLPGHPPLRRDLRRDRPPRAARLDRALLPRGDDHQQRPQQVVRGRRVAPGDVHLPARPCAGCSTPWPWSAARASPPPARRSSTPRCGPFREGSTSSSTCSTPAGSSGPSGEAWPGD